MESVIRKKVLAYCEVVVTVFLAAEKDSGRLDELAEEYIYRYIETQETLEPAA